jgi:uncharacterized protein YqhQ
MSGTQSKKPDVVAQMRAEMAQEERDKKKEQAVWTIRMIWMMAIFFVITVFELDGVFYALTSFFAELMSGMMDTSTWVQSMKGSMRVLLIGGFGVSTLGARFLSTR